MAYVAISQALREDVRRNIVSKKTTEVNLLDRPATTVVAKPADPIWTMFEDKMWGDRLHLKDILPPEWCRSLNTATLRGTATITTVDEDGAEPHVMTINANANVAFQPNMVLPPNAETYNTFVRVNDAQLDPNLGPIVEYELAVRAINKKWDAILRQVDDFLMSCKSLNQALKLWPDLRIYVPSPYVQRVDVVVERAKSNENKALEALKNLDTEAAVANAVMVRILQANKLQAGNAG